MPNRLDIEITSQSNDSFYTWRSAGAKEPKGTIKATLVPSGVAIGDVLRVEADFMMDGIEIISVLPTRQKKDEPELLEIIGSGKESLGVTTSLVSKGNKKRNSKKGRNNKSTRSSERKNKTFDNDKRIERKKRRPYQPPRGKRLKPARKRRNDYISNLPLLHQTLAKELVGSSIPDLRKTLKKMSLPEGCPEALLDYAEKLNQDMKMAEWLDKAESVENNLAKIDLQDFRSVVASSERWAKSAEAIVIKERLGVKLTERIDSDHREWLASIKEALKEEKTVRALNLSSRSPKAGAQLPENLGLQLSEQAGNALNNLANPYRWSVVMEAVALSPVREKVIPQGLPTNITDDLKKSIAKHAERIPQIAELFATTS
jgi:hypothetical protein